MYQSMSVVSVCGLAAFKHSFTQQTQRSHDAQTDVRPSQQKQQPIKHFEVFKRLFSSRFQPPGANQEHERDCMKSPSCSQSFSSLTLKPVSELGDGKTPEEEIRDYLSLMSRRLALKHSDRNTSDTKFQFK